MKKKINGPERQLVLDVYNERTIHILQSLASKSRIRILEILSRKALVNVSDIAKELKMPMSTAILHIKKLEEGNLIHTEQRPSSGGIQKVCHKVYNKILVNIPDFEEQKDNKTIEIEMPIGAFSHCQIFPTCGIVGPSGIIGFLDDPMSFFEPKHTEAQLLWFRKGYVEYIFPNRIPPKEQCVSCSLSMELCSEAPMYNLDWPSDITLWINNKEVGTWTSPADFGGERGILTPAWWSERNTQYGLLKEWKITKDGCFIDGIKISERSIADFALAESKFISVKLGVKEDAQYVGGLNLFGNKFGNYRQGIVLHMIHSGPTKNSPEKS